ncbi:MAG: hypothetical protein OXG97_08700 [Candidatus Poribacteria bacterium]|nr:hypothetical protein [Candidatus Poribacteria bacterium]
MFRKFTAYLSIIALIVTLCTSIIPPPDAAAHAEYVETWLRYVDCYEQDGTWMAYCTSWTIECSYTQDPPDDEHYNMFGDHVDHSQVHSPGTDEHTSKVYSSCSQCDS